MATLTETSQREIDRYYSVMVDRGLYTNKRNLRNYLFTVFHQYDFTRKRILDIGGGSGLLSFFAASMGAEEAVCLEPEGAGSSSGMTRNFEEASQALGLEQARLESLTIQEYEARDTQFDLIVLYNSINHLDEQACIRLLENEQSRNSYRKLLGKLSLLMKPGGTLIVCDCSRHNLFPRLGLTNPFVPNIEWHKHQAPQTWAELLRAAGFVNPAIRWTTFHSLGASGRFLLGNRFCSYCIASHFCLTMTRGTQDS